MAKEPMSEEARKAFALKMQAAKRAKKPQTNTQKEEAKIVEEVPANPAPVDHGTQAPADYAELQRQMNELKGYLFDVLRNGVPAAAPSGPSVTGHGIVGTLEKYILDPAHYPNPCERLAKEPKLQRFAFDMNFELEWHVGITQYDTKDGIHVKEPKFEIQLNRIVMDEETGQPTDGRYIITQGIFHEDPQAALAVAAENDVEIEGWEEKAFLDEMRYLRLRDWLLEAFYTPLPASRKSNKREMAVGGKMVQYFEINSEDASGIPFGKLTNKL